MKKIFLFILPLLITLIACEEKSNVNIDYTDIDTAIESCLTLHNNAEEGEGIGEFVIGSKATFKIAIDEAEYVREKTDRQSALDNYIVKLDNAKQTFEGSRVEPACLFFDGASYVNCGPASEFYNETFTMETWVYFNEWTGGSIFGAEGNGDNGLFGLLVRVAESVPGAIDYTIVNGTWSGCVTGENVVSLNDWVHIAITFDSENAKVYINGVESASLTIGTYIPQGDARFILGDLATWGGRNLRGKMYDVRIWDVVRTQEQISSTYNTLLEGDEEGLVANWPFNVKTGNEIIDITGNYTASLVNVSWADLDNN